MVGVDAASLATALASPTCGLRMLSLGENGIGPDGAWSKVDKPVVSSMMSECIDDSSSSDSEESSLSDDE